MNYYKHFFGSYDKHTKSLSILQHGIYRLLIDYYFVREAPLPPDIDTIAEEIGVRTRIERQALEKVLHRFFVLEDGKFHNKRCDEDLDVYRQTIARNSEGGKKSGEVRRKKAMDDGEIEVPFDSTSTILPLAANTTSTPLPVPFKTGSASTNHEPRTTNHEDMGEGGSADAHAASDAPLTPKATSKARKLFNPPSLEEATGAFALKFAERFPTIRDPAAMQRMAASWAEDFLNYYEKVGWKVGRNTMQNWNMAIAGWFKRNIEEGKHLRNATNHDNTGRNDTGNSDISGEDLQRALSVGRRT